MQPLGGGWNSYNGDHYGYVIWAEHSSNSFIDKPWYENTGKKTDFNVFAKANYQLNKFLNLYGDLQVRNIDYSIDGTHDDLRDLTQEHSFTFFNPKGGVYSSRLIKATACMHRLPLLIVSPTVRLTAMLIQGNKSVLSNSLIWN